MKLGSAVVRMDCEWIQGSELMLWLSGDKYYKPENQHS